MAMSMVVVVGKIKATLPDMPPRHLLSHTCILTPPAPTLLMDAPRGQASSLMTVATELFHDNHAESVYLVVLSPEPPGIFFEMAACSPSRMAWVVA